MFDDRVLRVGISLNGIIRTYETLQISCNGSKFTSPIQNEFTVKITNLSQDTREEILTQVNLKDRATIKPQIYIYCGRKSYEPELLFIGDIRSAIESQPPDIAITLKANTNDLSKLIPTSRSGNDTTPLSTLSKIIASNLQKKLTFEATDIQIANYSYTGTALGELEKLQEVANVNAYIDNDVLIVKDRSKPLNNTTIEINKDTGMVGTPDVTERGVKVKILFLPNISLGGEINLTTEKAKTLNGRYEIYKMTYDLTNRDLNFYISLECERIN